MRRVARRVTAQETVSPREARLRALQDQDSDIPEAGMLWVPPWCTCKVGRQEGYLVTEDPKVCVHNRCGKPTRLVWEKHCAPGQA